jgi:hypothetical protein
VIFADGSRTDRLENQRTRGNAHTEHNNEIDRDIALQLLQVQATLWLSS